MNRHLLLLWILLGSLLLLGAECETGDDDDDVAGDDDDASDDDDDAADDDDAIANPIVISGTVLAIDRDTGSVLNDDQFAARATLVVVYLLPDPADLSEVVAKVVLEDPGAWSLQVEASSGPLYAVAIADFDMDRIIASRDVLREYAFNPIQVGSADIGGIDLVLDVVEHAGGPSDPPAITTLDCTVDLVNVNDGPIAVASFSEAGSGPHGPVTHLNNAQDFAHPVHTSMGIVNVVGYLDSDLNNVFEPSDHVGGATINPIVLGLPIGGVTVQIPMINGFPMPTPATYVSITGTVEYSDFTTGDVLVFASQGGMDGEVWFRQTLAAPGPFALRAPANTDGVVVWAVLDADGDGAYDLDIDMQATTAAFSTTTSSVTGVELELGPAPGQGTVTGTIDWTGTASPGDVLYLGATTTPTGPPIYNTIVEDVTFPYDYEFAGVGTGVWYIGAYLDIGGDSDQGPGPGDPDGQYEDAVELLDGDVLLDVDFSID